MLRFRWLNFIIVSVFSLLMSCGKSLPALDGIDTKLWTADKNGCQLKRSEMSNAIRSQKEKLLALDEMQIVKLLGKPDENELYKRNQKFYYYYLKPSRECGVTFDSHATDTKLVIRFNAMGLAKEVVIE